MTRDPELDGALRRATMALGKRPAATLVRELALRGAADLPPTPPSDAIRQLIEDHGGRLAQGSLATRLTAGELHEPIDPRRAATSALDDLRAERFP